MPADNDKRAAQLAFMDAENVKALYERLQMEGTVIAGEQSLTQQIAQDIVPEIQQPEIEQEIGLEPER
jgi:hypothetical protein